MAEWTAKRFWKDASIVEAGDGFTVLLDGRKLRTPVKSELIVPTRKMAEAIASEWDAQIEKVDPLTMPVTRSANAARRSGNKSLTATTSTFGWCWKSNSAENLQRP